MSATDSPGHAKLVRDLMEICHQDEYFCRSILTAMDWDFERCIEMLTESRRASQAMSPTKVDIAD